MTGKTNSVGDRISRRGVLRKSAITAGALTLGGVAFAGDAAAQNDGTTGGTALVMMNDYCPPPTFALPKKYNYISLPPSLCIPAESAVGGPVSRSGVPVLLACELPRERVGAEKVPLLPRSVPVPV
ncbi:MULTISPECIES: twin-arginine translocation signal domain-containing protein [Haloferax]|uniref:Twin-arginine translocation signal domain-containing protein n=2 Tax=Haloferax TaxID=2251 RepID=A0A6G1YZV0_9EURY|nr:MULTISPECIES: twin-arginine translocation signal domain-containing protein [Haloferax]KAB1187027.1 twin-arginine translocation signal domain-containing protein [Haloferax sp. CBA1149]MRW79661.1 twin-arginine translocation signal domain-containing protein [Haloferax marinisediminis]